MAMRMYEQRQAQQGAPPSHQFAKEMLAGLVGGEVGLPSYSLLSDRQLEKVAGGVFAIPQLTLRHAARRLTS